MSDCGQEGFVFSPITIDDKQLFLDVLTSSELYKDTPASETDFQSLFCWGAADHPQKCVIDEGIVIFFEHEFGVDKVFYPPLVRKKEDFVPVMRRIVDYCGQKGMQFYFDHLTEDLVGLLQAAGVDDGRIIKNDCSSEYLHSPADMINLPGKNFKSKRNQVSTFKSDYDYEVVPYDKSMRDELLQLVKDWGDDITSKDFTDEYDAIARSLDYFDRLGMLCDVIKIDGRVIAFEIGYINHSNVGVVIFEKADIEYRGAFQAISNFFVSNHFANCRYVNRQEDLCIEGLRDAKMSYHPVAFADKYIFTNRADVK